MLNNVFYIPHTGYVYFEESLGSGFIFLLKTNQFRFTKNGKKSV